MVKLFIFDFDGLIFDTESYDLQAFEQLYKSYGSKFPKQQWLSCIGGSLNFDPYEAVLKARPHLIREVIRQERRQIYQALISEAEPREGVRDYLDQAKNKGHTLALASSSTRSWVDNHLSLLGLESTFDFICTADDVERVKPDPELFLHVLDNFQSEPESAVVFEDSPNGAKAAIRAGIPCVAIPNPTTRDLFFDKQIHLRVETMSDPILKQLI
ncbi:HAD-IA family hydrolase [Halobacillus litoralis]|uniref:HAD family hydrolase n=1 Tax=Halobacillus litoralis TaxID=45668 RepID=UPI001CD5FFEA|nr:HAD-IA family hydrolase [Halobacillus litoralis]MCA0970171.1 HAD-IA family hydrolase [Halobacillus litoralis]